MTRFGRVSIGFLVAALLLMALPAMAQNPLALTAGSATGALTATNASCTSTACVMLPINALVGSVAAQITGTFVGTVTFEATVDGTNYVAIAVIPVGATRTLTTTATAAGMWQLNASGYAAVRARCSAFTSGTINVTLKRSAGKAPSQ